MTDLEITRLCAEAMKYRILSNEGMFERDEEILISDGEYDWYYGPLHDDAQAMALVKRFGLSLERDIVTFTNMEEGVLWMATNMEEGVLWMATNIQEGFGTEDINLNRAICSVVAAMQVAKLKP